ncbi:MAG: hypothetical protein KatS3mg105_2933 [Gemmatales bacterium]|nr:MAG: hypothetical protein KatS3mg105_2933 [Gemmatales bacterium]
MRNLQDSTAQLNRLAYEARQFLQYLSRSNGTLNALISDATLYNHLTDAACIIRRTLPRVDRILSDLEVFADKIARHPEAIGIGGVVRPGSGLK